MGFFAFDGNNIIYTDMIQTLPDGKVYFKEKNIIPYIDSVTFVENFGAASVIPPGTNVEVYVDDVLYQVKQTILNAGNSFIYSEMKPPYGKFTVKTVINGKVFNEQIFYAINIFAFYVIIAKTYNYDYTELFKLFGNLFYNTTQNSILEDMYGWYFYFKQGTMLTADYRRALVGDTTNYLGTVRSFVNHAITQFGLVELIKSFVGVAPLIYAYREFDGFYIREAGLPPTGPNIAWQLPRYWMVNFVRVDGTANLTTVDVSGLTLELKINNCQMIHTFAPSTVGTAAIISDLKKTFKGFVIQNGNYLRLQAVYVEVVGGTAVGALGLTVGVYTDNVLEDVNTKRAILMSKEFKIYNIRIWIPVWPYDDATKQILERLIRHIIPVNVKYEILYGTTSIWCPIR